MVEGALMIQTPRPVAILGGNRIPFARADGAYAQASTSDLLAAALDGLITRFGLDGDLLGEVVAGAVLKHARDFNLTREVVLGSRLDPRTPAYDLQRACGTSLEAVAAVGNKIALGQIDAGIAGGADSASDAPLAVHDDLRRHLLAARRARGVTGTLRALARARPRHLLPEAPRNAEPRTGLSMGDHAARTALEHRVGRAAQDELAARSHRRLAQAYDEGLFDDLMTPYLGLTRDDVLRADSTPERLAQLRTVFGEPGTATMTAGNSTALTDGAATVLLSSQEWARERGHDVLAYLVDVRTAAVDFVSGADGLLMAPVYAVPELLRRAGLTLDDIDLVEIHEAFAAQVLATLDAWSDPAFCKQRLGLPDAFGTVPPERLNIAGSSLATGHPFAATGARIVATLATLLSTRAGEIGRPTRGLISICAAGGQGVVALLEAPC